MPIPSPWLTPQSDPIFGPLWQLFYDVAPDAHWESLSKDGHEKNHCVWVRWKGQAHGIGFAHELAALPKEKFAALLSIYFGEETEIA